MKKATGFNWSSVLGSVSEMSIRDILASAERELEASLLALKESDTILLRSDVTAVRGLVRLAQEEAVEDMDVSLCITTR